MKPDNEKTYRTKLNKEGVEHIASDIVDRVIEAMEIETQVVRKLSKKDIERVAIKVAIRLLECYTEEDND